MDQLVLALREAPRERDRLRRRQLRPPACRCGAWQRAAASWPPADGRHRAIGRRALSARRALPVDPRSASGGLHRRAEGRRLQSDPTSTRAPRARVALRGGRLLRGEQPSLHRSGEARRTARPQRAVRRLLRRSRRSRAPRGPALGERSPRAPLRPHRRLARQPPRGATLGGRGSARSRQVRRGPRGAPPSAAGSRRPNEPAGDGTSIPHRSWKTDPAVSAGSRSAGSSPSRRSPAATVSVASSPAAASSRSARRDRSGRRAILVPKARSTPPFTGTGSPSGSAPASWPAERALGSSASASGLPAASSSKRRRTAVATGVRGGSVEHGLRVSPSQPLELEARQSPCFGLRELARAAGDHHRDLRVLELARDEQEGRARRLVEPLGVVDDRQDRSSTRRSAQHTTCTATGTHNRSTPTPGSSRPSARRSAFS